ncbi:hypothetical protein JCM16358_11940 [Halanaerocella petrolearia]
MNKNIIKRIVKFEYEGLTHRVIEKKIKTMYGDKITNVKIRKILKSVNYDNRFKYTSYQKRVILKLYSEFYDTDKVVWYLKKRFGINTTKRALMNLAHKNNIKKKTRNRYSQSYTSRAQEKEIIKLYKRGKSLEEIRVKFGYKTGKSISDILNKHNVKRRSYKKSCTLLTDYYSFDLTIIDSEEKAYLIGLMITDGYLIEKDKGIGLSLADEDCISFLADYIGMDYAEVKRKGENIKKKFRLHLYGHYYCKQTKRYGMVQDKTHKCKGPNLKENEYKYIPYILRGIIDGDGWVRKDGKEFFICSASKDFIKWCLKSLESLGFKDLKIKFKDNEWNGIYLIRTAIQDNIKILNKFIYDKPFEMNRKYGRLKEGPSETIIKNL